MKPIAAALALFLAGPALAQTQESGRVGSGAPEDIFMEVTHGDDGAPVLSQDEFTLAHGGYYRFNLVCPEELTSETGFHFEATELLENAHIRVLSVAETDLEFYMQGLSFRAIECDDAGTARFSFHPMRKGVYPIYVRDQSIPPKEVFGRIIVE
ncbi:hypothetical protein ILP92_09760 [Maribius pontilimi]|uniref:Uncharacterized protein n=1 Tax=Palleronia pontilimi TaxID=1964209 RepID=A0A934I9R1_9RHOB|nr:hypothetical protein [Palleronia pontilimi]MBJ3763028.1 hypothetical protein [Palleronia pontilimi]